MKIVLLVFPLGVVLLLLMSCAKVPKIYELSPSTQDHYYLSDDDVTGLSKLADMGDADAALRLFKYYLYCTNEEELRDQWLEVAVLLGSNSAKSWKEAMDLGSR